MREEMEKCLKQYVYSLGFIKSLTVQIKYKATVIFIFEQSHIKVVAKITWLEL